MLTVSSAVVKDGMILSSGPAMEEAMLLVMTAGTPVTLVDGYGTLIWCLESSVRVRSKFCSRPGIKSAASARDRHAGNASDCLSSQKSWAQCVGSMTTGLRRRDSHLNVI
ncbi:hypothetical protein N657DRAFT_26630 [Parathielavia appendiculata]|uniref:Uncharacterized protein n=1 Tax=Parathielavia appendiculata TaxID=2587402 RepID=A0AAN6UBH9_9PEZI|nr:hypothetical protein N657DRAFT_26630 [Parathielavia appendiculata]